ncbi:hypothetical protein AAHC03_05196 [Spirometra sp. Aus1]
MVVRRPEYFDGQMEPGYSQITRRPRSTGPRNLSAYEKEMISGEDRRQRSHAHRDQDVYDGASRRKGEGWVSDRRHPDSRSATPTFFSEEEYYEKRRAQSVNKDRSRRPKSTPKPPQSCSCGSSNATTLSTSFPPRAPEPPVNKKAKGAIVNCKADPTYVQKHVCPAVRGPPKQVRLPARSMISDTSRVSYRSLCDDTFVVKRDRTLDKAPIGITEGPKANKFIPRPGTVTRKECFPLPRVDQFGNEMEEIITKPKRGVDALIFTNTFYERGLINTDKPAEAEEKKDVDAKPWAVYDSYKPGAEDPLNEVLSEMRIEFKQKSIKPNPGIEGRLFFDALKPTRVESVVLNVNYNLTYGAADGTQTEGSESKTYEIPLVGHSVVQSKKPSTTPDAEGKVKGTYKLTQGPNEIPFTLTFPADSIPSFIYVDDDGRTAISSYSVEAVTTLEKQTIPMDRISIDFPTFGMDKAPVDPQDTGTFKLALENKYFTPETGLNILVLDESGKGKGMSYKIAQKVTCPALGLDGAQKIVAQGNMDKTEDSEILKRIKELGVQVPDDYKATFEGKYSDADSLLPRSVATDGFTCTYEVEVTCSKSETYEADIIVCDHLLPAPFQPRHIPQTVRENTGWRKIEKSKK